MRASAGMRPRSATSTPVMASAPSAISATSRGTGRSLLALARSYRPSDAGLERSRRRRRRSAPPRDAARVARDGSQLLVVRGAAGLLVGRQRPAVLAGRARAPAALVGAAVDGAGDDLAAEAVLVAVGRQVVQRVLQLDVRVVLVEVVVAGAVGHRVGLRHGRQRQQRERAQQKQVSYDSGHGADFLLEAAGGVGGRSADGKANQHLPSRAAQASNHYGGAWRVVFQPSVVPGLGSSLNAVDPPVGAKLRCAAALRNPRPGPGAVPRAAVHAAC